jgi:hypothetical protein
VRCLGTGATLSPYGYNGEHICKGELFFLLITAHEMYYSYPERFSKKTEMSKNLIFIYQRATVLLSGLRFRWRKHYLALVRKLPALLTTFRVLSCHDTLLNLPMRLSTCCGITSWLRTGRPGFDSRKGQWLFPFATLSTQGVLSLGVKRPRHISDHHLVPRLRMSGAIPPLPHTSSWRGAQLSRGTTLAFIWYIRCMILSCDYNKES